MSESSKFFRFQKYCFPNQVIDLENYLTSSSIKYNKSKSYIKFFISSNLFKDSSMVKAYYQGNNVTSIRINCASISFSKRKEILEAIEEQYKFLRYNADTSIRVYQDKDYEIKVIGNEKYRIIVEFEPTGENDYLLREPELKKVILFTLGGIVLSTVSILLYIYFKNIIWLNVITLAICISYALYQFIHLYIIPSSMDRIYKIAFSIIVPVVFIIIALIVLLFFIIREPQPNAINWSMIGMIFCYLTPSFHLLLLLMLFLGYGL